MVKKRVTRLELATFSLGRGGLSLLSGVFHASCGAAGFALHKRLHMGTGKVGGVALAAGCRTGRDVGHTARPAAWSESAGQDPQAAARGVVG
jgi:hypothetical protein